MIDSRTGPALAKTALERGTHVTTALAALSFSQAPGTRPWQKISSVERGGKGVRHARR